VETILSLIESGIEGKKKMGDRILSPSEDLDGLVNGYLVGIVVFKVVATRTPSSLKI
jgi:hypothetical protein